MKIFFPPFSAYLNLVCIEITPERSFLILEKVLQFFEFFCYFFLNFLARVEYERNSGVKFCFHFFGLSHPVFTKNNVGNRFYNFLNFLTIFFGIFLLGSSMNGILEKNFVFTFSAYFIPFAL